MGTIYETHLFPWSILAWLVPSSWPHLRMTNAVAWDLVFKGQIENKEAAIARFKEWEQEVKRAVPADKLLVFDCRQGWEPLCDFLNVPIPAGTPFPKTNTRSEFNLLLRKIMLWYALKDFILPVGIAAAAIWLGLKLYS